MDFSQREKMFGTGDHKRLYGLDLTDKLKSVGFKADVYSLDDVKGNYFDRSVESPHIESNKYIFVGTK